MAVVRGSASHLGTQHEGLQVKKPTPLPRASHTNIGTSVAHDELPWPERPGTVLGHRKLHLEEDLRPDVTAAGGLVLPLALLRHFKIPQLLDEREDTLRLPDRRS